MIDPVSVHIESPAFAGDVAVHELTGRETVSQLFEFSVHVVTKRTEGLDDEAILTDPAEVVFTRGNQPVRRIYGMIAAFRDALHTESRYLGYTLTFVPRAWRMTLNHASEVFLDLTVPEIITQKLERYGFAAGKDFELRLRASYPTRDATIQYKESDLQFVSRLAEHLGIAFFFEHEDGRDVMVFSDDNSGFKPIGGGGTAHYYARGEQTGVFSLQGTTRTLPNRYVVKDYNYRTPQVSLLASSNVSKAGTGDVIEYGAHFKTPEEGDRIALVRAEELRAGHRVFDGKSDRPELAAGTRFVLEGHPRVDGELLLVEVRHAIRQVALGFGDREGQAYVNDFHAIPAATMFRPARVTPKPRVHGAITGIVEAAERGQYAEIDDGGRYHVRFMFDVGEAAHGGASRLVRMAQPHAGPGYGFHFPLRDGVEVMLTCIEGDPDRPIITGAVPNPITPTTVGAGNAKRNVIRTGGGSEINLDDNEGGTRIKMSVPYGNTFLQLGAPNHPGKGVCVGTGNDVWISAGGKIEGDASDLVDLHAGTVFTIRADAKLAETAPIIDLTAGSLLRTGAPRIEINGGADIDAGANTVKIVGRATLMAEAPTLTIRGNAFVFINGGSVVDIKGGAEVTVNSGATTTISSGGAVTVKAPVVNIEGGTVNVDSGGVVNVHGSTIKLNS
jgi:type VI secretion system secreted protein VgrG